jgi:hypothetical protein
MTTSKGVPSTKQRRPTAYDYAIYDVTCDRTVAAEHKKKKISGSDGGEYEV